MKLPARSHTNDPQISGNCNSILNLSLALSLKRNPFPHNLAFKGTYLVLTQKTVKHYLFVNPDLFT